MKSIITFGFVGCLCVLIGFAAVGQTDIKTHLDRGGEEAKAQVGSSSQVRQSVGPGKETNRRARYAEQLLRRWGIRSPA